MIYFYNNFFIKAKETNVKQNQGDYLRRYWLDGIGIDEIGLIWFMLIDAEYGNCKIVNDREELTRNFNQKKSRGKWTDLA